MWLFPEDEKCLAEFMMEQKPKKKRALSRFLDVGVWLLGHLFLLSSRQCSTASENKNTKPMLDRSRKGLCSD